MKIGTNAKLKYTRPPSSVPRTAVFSSLAEVTRWKMSCCGTEPIASVSHAVPNASHSLAPPFGQKSNLPASAAAAITLPAPPAMSPTTQATSVTPMMIITDWKRSVSATDHMPPHTVYPSTTAAPSTMPSGSGIAPLESVENASPSAVICAEVQPRYENVMTTLVTISIGRL